MQIEQYLSFLHVAGNQSSLLVCTSSRQLQNCALSDRLYFLHSDQTTDVNKGSRCFATISYRHRQLSLLVNISTKCESRLCHRFVTRVVVFSLSGFVQSRSLRLQTEEAESVFGLRRAGRSGVLSRPACHRRWAIHVTGTTRPNPLPWQLII